MASSTVLNWFQRTVPWSNSARAWVERLAFLGLVLATVALLRWGHSLSLFLYVLAWGTLLVLFGFVLRQGWFFVFGPVLFYDLVRSARRARTYIIRFLYVGLLFFLLCWMYYVTCVQDAPYRASDTVAVARFTMLFFTVFVSAQLAITVLMTPAYVAGAISEEKERKTIEYILATDLRNREIVLGKFVARLLHLTMLLIAGLPIVSALQFMGGIDPDLLLASYAGIGMTMLSIAGLSIFASTVARRTRDAILMVYLAMLVFFGLWGCSEWLNFQLGANSFPSSRYWTSPVTLGDLSLWLVTGFRVGNPLYALAQIGRSNAIVGSVVWATVQEYALFHGAIAVVSLLASMALLRRVALATPKPPPKGRTWFGLGSKRKLPPVGNYPMIWKEVHAERGFRLHIVLRILFVLLVILSILPLLGIFIYFLDNNLYGNRFYYRDPWSMLGEEVNHYVRVVGAMVGVLGLVGVMVRAATAVRGEREKDTFDAILTSPMSGEEILFGKWLGSILSVRWVAVWLLFIWGVGVFTGGMNLFMFPLLVMCWLVYAAASASLGLWFSVVSGSSLRAILATLSTALLIGGGHWIVWGCACCLMGVARSGPSGGDAFETVLQLLLGITPPLVLGFFPFRTEEFTTQFDRHMNPIKILIFGMGGTFCWAIFAWGVWQATNERFKRLTHRSGKKTPDPVMRATVLSAWPEK